MNSISAEDRKKHWDHIYETKPLETVSWYQPKPETSLDLISALHPLKNDRIIDIGGGDSFLSDYLLRQGYENITVLDLSAIAIKRAQDRLQEKAKHISWIVSDILDFNPEKPYDIWHDRAAFHFLTDPESVRIYRQIAENGIKVGGHLILGAFSVNGPTKCSGLPIQQYDFNTIQEAMGISFKLLQSAEVDHPTPGGSVQKFLFATFERI